MNTRSAYECLSTKICPWLEEPLAHLEEARQEERFAHGWILAGPPGLGKINLALVVANRLLRPQAPAPTTLEPKDAASAMAQRHEPGDHHPDLHWVFPGDNKRTLSVDQVREISSALALTSLEGAAKVVVLEPADAMTISAANALLKTLEEPTERTYLLLVTHQPGQLPATIRSRCQTLPVPIPGKTMALDWLATGNTDVSQRDWIQLLAFSEGAPFKSMAFQESDYINKNKVLDAVFHGIYERTLDPQNVADDWMKEKDDLVLALSWLATRLRWAIRARVAPQASNPITDLTADSSHNAWQELTPRTLFQRLQHTEMVLNQLGKGINTDLAIRALFLGFQGEKGLSRVNRRV